MEWMQYFIIFPSICPIWDCISVGNQGIAQSPKKSAINYYVCLSFSICQITISNRLRMQSPASMCDPRNSVSWYLDATIDKWLSHNVGLKEIFLFGQTGSLYPSGSCLSWLYLLWSYFRLPLEIRRSQCGHKSRPFCWQSFLCWSAYSFCSSWFLE